MVAQSCLTFCDLMDYSPPGSSLHGIPETRILEWVAIHFSRGSSQPRGQTQVFCFEGRFFTIWANREDPSFANLFTFSWISTNLIKGAYILYHFLISRNITTIITFIEVWFMTSILFILSAFVSLDKFYAVHAHNISIL